MKTEIDMAPLSLFEEFGLSYFETNLAGFITQVNEPFSKELGYTPEELTGRHYQHFTDPQHLPRIAQVFKTIHETGLPVRNLEYKLQRRDGSASFAEGAITLVKDASGQPAGFRGVLQDVSRHKAAEALLIERSETLQEANQASRREMEIGRRIQAGFLPDQLPQPTGWEIASYFQAARVVAGDFYDAFSLSGGKRIGLVIADVCDKGIGAALFMALFRSLIRAFADQHYSLKWMDVLSNGLSTEPAAVGAKPPSEPGTAGPGPSAVGRRRALLSTGTTALKNAIDLTNNYITRNHGRTNMFATIFFGVLDPATGLLMYINGGHEPPLVIGPEGVKARLEPTGPAVGLFPNMDFGIGQVELEKGDVLLAYTDGVLDANSPTGSFFGEERLLSLAQQPAETAQALLDRIRGDLEGHIGQADQYDDITLLAVARRDAAQGAADGFKSVTSNEDAIFNDPKPRGDR